MKTTLQDDIELYYRAINEEKTYLQRRTIRGMLSKLTYKERFDLFQICASSPFGFKRQFFYHMGI